MKRLVLFIYLFSIICYAQSRWEDHFSYKEVKEIHQIGNKLYCVSSNALFNYNIEDSTIEKISKINLLNSVKPTSAAYNATNDYLLIGYENGELDILGEESENFIEIPLDDYNGSKKINHISTAGNIMLISAAYGVSIFDLDKREFSETTFFRKNGEEILVNESEIFNNKIFAATDKGIYYHEIDELIPNFNDWTLINDLPTNKKFQHIQKFGDKLTVSSGGELYVFNNNHWEQKILGNTYAIEDLNESDGYLVASSSKQVFVLDNNFTTIKNYKIPDSLDSTINSAIYVDNTIYVGTNSNGLINTDAHQKILPDGPFNNNAYHVTAHDQHIWVAPGGQNNFNSSLRNQDGIFHFNKEEWVHIDNDELLKAEDIIHISYNPQNPNEIYASTWGQNINQGLLQIKDDELVRNYTKEFTNLHSNNSDLIRLGGSTFDKEGNLYVSQAFVLNPEKGNSAILKRTPKGVWSAKIFPKHAEASGIKAPVVGRNGYIWAPQTRENGVAITNMNEFYRITSAKNNGDLPSDNVYAIAIDNNGTAWIGTQLGLRIKRNPIAELKRGNASTESIVIEHNGIPEALFTDTAISDIVVDNSNRKWVATLGAGVFYLSESGKEIIHHFTEEDSPLSSNIVTSIAVDDVTGKVFFATDVGLISYLNDVKDTGDNFGEVVAYPNPVRPGYNGNITVKGLAKGTDVRITDVAGNLIFKGKEAGGIVQWNQLNLKGEPVASGVYIVMLISGDGMENKFTKIAIIR